MDRREVLKRTALILGYAVSATAIGGVLSGCGADTNRSNSISDSNGWEPKFFSKEDIQLIIELTETMLPATDTPGAKEAETYKFIDIMLKDNYHSGDQKRFMQGLKDVDASCNTSYGRGFLNCTTDQRLSFLTQLDSDTKILIDQNSSADLNRPFYAILKELTWLGFFSSEIIGEQYLAYDPVPGPFIGCTSIDETEGYLYSE